MSLIDRDAAIACTKLQPKGALPDLWVDGYSAGMRDCERALKVLPAAYRAAPKVTEEELAKQVRSALDATPQFDGIERETLWCISEIAARLLTATEGK